jgi:hypothetical protein
MKREPSRDSLGSIVLPLALILGLVLLLSLDIGQANGESPSSPLESWLKLLVSYLAAGAEIAAALVIGSAVLRSIGTYLR